MSEKMFTQKEVNDLINKRLAKVKQVDNTELISERDELLGRLNEYETKAKEAELKKQAIEAGVDKDLVGFALGQVEDGDFGKFLENNPKFKAENFQRKNSNPSYEGGNSDIDERNKRRQAMGLEKL